MGPIERFNPMLLGENGKMWSDKVRWIDEASQGKENLAQESDPEQDLCVKTNVLKVILLLWMFMTDCRLILIEKYLLSNWDHHWKFHYARISLQRFSPVSITKSHTNPSINFPQNLNNLLLDSFFNRSQPSCSTQQMMKVYKVKICLSWMEKYK